ncbi:protein FAM117A-like isoform X2 [Clupea harengus]|uniref:Protein FAM117A-like isoform X2 n=1 Tax=Clupea harengus TaxID=7950 RepID=A0A6P8EZ42_CLUHA|nr:protein FAM117A-like isoform X2 [Clupea harengus]
MCSRGGVGVARGSSGLQPMKATVPFQLSNSSSSKPQPALRDAKSAAVYEKPLWCSLNGQIPHSQSLDSIVGPYLHGHWPKDGAHYKKDKSTQTPASWADDQQSSPGGGIHKRSASWGSATHREVSRQRQQQQQHAVVLGGSLDRRRTHALTQAGSSPWITQSQPVTIPLNALHTRLRHSEEKLDQELETIFKHQTLLQLPDFLVPNGRRGPVPPYSNCSSYSEHQSGLSSSSSSSSPSSSPASSLSSSSSCSPGPSPMPHLLEPDGEVCVDGGPSEVCVDGGPSEVCVDGGPSARPSVGGGGGALSLLVSSPHPNKSVCFQREPPEGCEKVPVCEDALGSVMTQVRVPTSCPDPDKVNFRPRRGSTFCPVSLHKPHLPSIDFLFRNLSVSPGSEWAGQTGTGTPSLDSATTKRETEMGISNREKR